MSIGARLGTGLPRLLSAAAMGPAASPLEDFVTLWVGPALTALERACLRSARRQGHRVALYCYDRPVGVPRGVAVRDAASILPRSAIIRHRNGSPSLFSNRFRYELLRRGLGTWIDCDVYFVRPLTRSTDYVFGWQEPGKLNTAVLRLPSDSPVLQAALRVFDEREIPPWLSTRARWASRLRLLTTGRTGLARMPWGSAGPEALTWLLKAAGLDHHAAPISRFYPVHWTQADWVMDPARATDVPIAADTIAIHLWSERLRGCDLASAPSGSFAHRLREEGA